MLDRDVTTMQHILGHAREAAELVSGRHRQDLPDLIDQLEKGPDQGGA